MRDVPEFVAQFGFLWLALPRAESIRHYGASIPAGNAQRPAIRLRHFQYRPYSQEFSISFQKFPFFDRAPHQADTLLRLLESRHARKAVMKRDAESFTCAITTKVTEAEFKQLEQLWSASGMTRSEWCRKALMLLPSARYDT